MIINSALNTVISGVPQVFIDRPLLFNLFINDITFFIQYCTLSNYPANFSTSNQRCFSVVDQRWNNVDPTLKMKQNPTSDFKRCATLIQRRFPTLKQGWNDVDTILSRCCCFNVVSTAVKAISTPIMPVISRICK